MIAAPEVGAGHDRRRAVVGCLLAFAIPLALVSLAGALVRGLGAADGSNAFDQQVLDWAVDRRSDGLTSFMRTVTTLGSGLVFVPLTIAAVIALVVLRRAWLAGYFATVVIGASLLTSAGKAIVGRPRPPLDVRAAVAGGSSFPSGHSTQAAATYVAVGIVIGLLVTSRALRTACWVVLAVVIVGVGASRIVLGVHWTTDVVAGILVGSAWALGAASAFDLFERRSR